MNIKRFLASGLAAGFVYFMLGWVFYGMLFPNLYPKTAETNMSMITMGCFAFGIAIAWAMQHCTDLMSGIKFGAVLALLFGLCSNSFMYASIPMNSNNFITDLGVYAVSGAILGAIISFINSKIS